MLLSLVRGAVSVYLTASGTFMDDDVALFGVCDDLDRLHGSLALASAVTRININVKRPETVWAMISRRVSERLYLA